MRLLELRYGLCTSRTFLHDLSWGFYPYSTLMPGASLERARIPSQKRRWGLITPYAFVTLGPLRSFFIPEMLMGFPLQSLAPSLNR